MSLARARRALLSAVLLCVLPVLASTGAAHADVTWLCHPALTAQEDPCQAPLDTTVIAADGSRRAVTPARPPAAQRPVDCFYVYPTVSNQLGPNATKAKDPEIVAVAKFQASRFSPGCRMFAPVYREATVPAVFGNFVPAIAEKAYGDVAEAWRQYLAQDNGGRGVILIGHSQGTIMLRALIHRLIDPDPTARARLVGAVMLGGNVTTKAGQATGGDFGHVPVCTAKGQDGCVVAYSTSSTDPEPLNVFGNTDSDLLGKGFGLPSGPGYEVACTDPAILSGIGGPMSLTVPTAPFPPGFIAGGIALTANGPVPQAATTWVEGFRYQGACRTINGAHVLRYDAVDGSRRLNEFPPAWGTHLVDFNLGVEKLTTITARQTATWLGAHLAVGTVRRNRAAGTASASARIPGAGTVTVRGTRLRTTTARTAAPASIRLRIVPTAAALRSLRRTGRLTAAARVRYAPGTGPAVTQTRTVQLQLRRR